VTQRYAGIALTADTKTRGASAAQRLRSFWEVSRGSRTTRKLAAGFRDSYRQTIDPYRDCPDGRRAGVRKFPWSGQFR
jgi:hypothetical protein